MISATDRVIQLTASAKEKGLRLTPQRQLLLRILGSIPQHLTADQLYRRARRVMPSVSPATVYRNAQMLVRAGVISAIERTGGPAQYDVNLDDHHHFVCDGCQRLFDVHVSSLEWRLDPRSTDLDGAQVNRCRLQLRGVCARCQRRHPRAARRSSSPQRR